MKVRLLSLTTAVALAVVLSVAYVNAQEEAPAVDKPKPAKGFIVGEVISIPHYAMEGTHGEEAADAMKYEVEKGFPVGVVDEETGEVWVAVYRDNAPASVLEAANKHLIDLVGKKATVQGLMYDAGNVKVIRVSLASEY